MGSDALLRGTSNPEKDVVKIELGARSDAWPVETKEIVPYAIEALPGYFKGEAAAEVRVFAAERP